MPDYMLQLTITDWQKDLGNFRWIACLQFCRLLEIRSPLQYGRNSENFGCENWKFRVSCTTYDESLCTQHILKQQQIGGSFNRDCTDDYLGHGKPGNLLEGFLCWYFERKWVEIWLYFYFLINIFFIRLCQCLLHHRPGSSFYKYESGIGFFLLKENGQLVVSQCQRCSDEMRNFKHHFKCEKYENLSARHHAIHLELIPEETKNDKRNVSDTSFFISAISNAS